MKNKKLEKKVKFIFKRTSSAILNKAQMQKINGGNSTNDGDLSTLPGCAEQKTSFGGTIND
ncbi:hypothetical protein [Chryseobacterium sp. G0201]|uniref:hypothetical protein n=1 Tax=Chryseobacterium sp. G0201 TaxID=2487065 RepID=UPI000F4EA992|nr:hypothetical protein [Chryseobacterium sp. G0201]AZA54537.1 hypothetical protein EG348_16830 [Chryseobacterium sp. G0201]